MDSLLHKFGIEYKEEITSDVILENQTPNCYCDFMREQIDNKFGKMFSDSLLTVSDSLYVINNPNKFFYYANCDTWPNYPEDPNNNQDGYSEKLQRAVEKSIKYPAGYRKRPDYNLAAFTDVELTVTKGGVASINGYNFVFDIKSNYRYESYLETVIEKAMRKTEWTPATIRKRPVNSDMVLRVSFD